jgi:acetylornithine deacetylase
MSDPLSQDSIAALAQALVRIPSVNPAIAPEEAHGESAVSEFACAWLNDHGVRAWVDEVAPGRTNVVGEIVGGPGATLVLCAHLDTVGTARMTIPPFEPTIDGGRLYPQHMKWARRRARACADQHASRTFLSLVADEDM